MKEVQGKVTEEAHLISYVPGKYFRAIKNTDQPLHPNLLPELIRPLRITSIPVKYIPNCNADMKMAEGLVLVSPFFLLWRRHTDDKDIRVEGIDGFMHLLVVLYIKNSFERRTVGIYDDIGEILSQIGLHQ